MDETRRTITERTGIDAMVIETLEGLNQALDGTDRVRAIPTVVGNRRRKPLRLVEFAKSVLEETRMIRDFP
jgi:hypothetical protein